jgi:VanZ family protein
MPRHPRRPRVHSTGKKLKKPRYFYFHTATHATTLCNAPDDAISLPTTLMWSGIILLMAGDLGSTVYTRGLMAQLQQYFPFLQSVPTSQLNHIVRGTGHILAYALLMAFWQRAFRWQLPMHPIQAIFWSLVMTLIVAVLYEVRQSLHSSRSGNLSDVLLDMSGALIAAMVLYFCLFLMPGKIARAFNSARSHGDSAVVSDSLNLGDKERPGCFYLY